MQVKFSNEPVFEDKDLVNCIRFALTLHEASNVAHTITVEEVSSSPGFSTHDQIHLTLIKM